MNLRPAWTLLADGGRYASSSNTWKLLGVLHPVSAIAQYRASSRKTVSEFIVVEIMLVPDVRRELNLILILVLVGAVSHASVRRDRRCQLASIRQDLGNVLQTLPSQVFANLDAGDGRECLTGNDLEAPVLRALLVGWQKERATGRSR